MVWNLSGRGRRGADTDENGYVAQTPLSRFAPKHQRPAPKLVEPEDVPPAEEVVQQEPLPPRNVPMTPLNQLMYQGEDDAADAVPMPETPVPMAAPETAEQTEEEPAEVKPAYLTGLEEEPPISISILKRALPDRF